MTVRKRRRLRPACPHRCLPQYCAVKPIVGAKGKIWQWSGWHVGATRTLDATYGLSVQIAAASAVDSPDDLEMMLIIADHETPDHQTTVCFTDAEAETFIRRSPGSSTSWPQNAYRRTDFHEWMTNERATRRDDVAAARGLRKALREVMQCVGGYPVPEYTW